MPSDKALYALRVVQGLSYRTIAGRHGLNPDSVRSRVNRYARQLREESAVVTFAPALPDVDDLPPLPDDTPAIHAALDTLRGLDRMVRLLVVSDEHIPDHDPRALALNVAIARYIQPDVVIFNGDTFDFGSISRFAQDRRSGNGDVLRDLARPWRSYVQAMTDAAPRALRVFLDGNHNERLEAFANLAWQFGDTIEDAYAGMVRADGRVLWANGRQELYVGPYLVHHGERHGENAGKNSLEKDYGGAQSKVQGHTHGVSLYAKAVKLPGQDTWILATSLVAGFAGRNPPAYQKRRKGAVRWIHACAYGHVNMHGLDCHVYPAIYHERADGTLVAAVGTETFVAG